MKIRFLSLPVSLLLLAPGVLLAEQGSDDSPTPVNGTFGAVERFHGGASSALSGSIARIDRFFFDDRYTEGDTATSTLRVRLGVSLEEDDSSFIGSVNAQIALPGLSDRVQLLIEGSSDERFDDEGNTIPSESSRDSRFGDRVDFAGVGVRIRLFEIGRFRFTHDTGAQFSSGLRFFTRLRATAEYEVSPTVILRPTQLFFYDELRGGLGQTTRFDLDWSLGLQALVRSRSEVTYTEDTNGAEFFEQVSYLQTLDDTSGFGVRASLQGETRPSTVVTEYKTSVFYRQNVKWPWLSLQTEPFVRFPREEDFDSVFGIMLVSEVTFGDFA